MGANSKEVNIDLSFVYVPRTISDVLTEVSSMDDISKKLSKLSQYVIALEEEQRKIDAFKRELPLCMFLLKDAVERLKEEALLHKGEPEKPVTVAVTEEFIPVKGNSDEGGRVKKSNDISEKKNWMSSAQLWSTPVHYESIDFGKQGHFLHLKPSGEEERNERGAFMPFKEKLVGAVKEEKDNNGLPVEVLSLSMPVGERERVSNPIDLSLSRDNARIGCDSPQDKALHHHHQQQQRKQRRCWSAELHRKFVDALHQLGGAQTATPKQIREIMQVDGLTNDEVKSHLQKYRLHVRRLPMPNYAWMSTDDEQVISSETNVTQSGSPEGPLHLGASSAKGLSINDRESMEEDEEVDNKSESYTCNSKSIEANA